MRGADFEAQERAKCEKKLWWGEKHLAARMAEIVNFLYPRPEPQRPYRCRWCGSWHLFSPDEMVDRSQLKH